MAMKPNGNAESRATVARKNGANGTVASPPSPDAARAGAGATARADAKRNVESNERAALAKRALDTEIPITEWDRLSTLSRIEVEQLVELLKSIKQGDFT